MIKAKNIYADLNEGLVAYYSFNGNAEDESGNNNSSLNKNRLELICNGSN